MHDKIFYLKLEVRHGKRNFNALYHSKLFLVIHRHLLMVCEQLKFDPKKLQYGFLCLDGENGGDHIAVIDIDLSKPSLPTELQCSRLCFDLTKLDESYKIWFREVSLYKFTIAKYSMHSSLAYITYICTYIL